ncbi:hypothetical protein NC651_014731 [Populus alba x Populus x berolinensis]|nr:hypothetical protein NC651_014731 [Populus alba x Populus x berolinensis]
MHLFLFLLLTDKWRISLLNGGNWLQRQTWFRDYWLSQHQDENGFYDNAENDFGFDGNDVADLLPDTFDLDAGDYFTSLEAQFADFIEESFSPLPSDGMRENGFMLEVEAPKKDTGLKPSA